MKNWFYIVALGTLALGPFGCDNRQQGQEAQKTAAEKSPKITFAKNGIHDFGEMIDGDTVEHVFAFTNTGEFPLIINNVTASCGCTTPEWPHEPVLPGQKSSVTVRFDSRGKIGEQNKTITIFANTDPAMTDLQFRALVLPKPDSTQS